VEGVSPHRAIAGCPPTVRLGRRRGLARLWLIIMAATAVGCGPSRSALPLESRPTALSATSLPTTLTSPIPTSRPTGTQTPRLIASTIALVLPSALSRAVAFADGESVLLAGGLTTSGTTAAILQISLAGGRVTTVGQLAKPVHDAGGVTVGGLPTVFGGGNLAPSAAVQLARVGPGALIGQLPAPRADLVVVGLAGTAIVVGGGTPARVDPEVLSTSDGMAFQRVATLRVGVRYPAVAVSGGSIIVVGGTDGVDDRTDIQAIDPATGSVQVIGHLPHALSHAAALVVAGRLLIAGGRSGGQAQDAIWEVDPVSGAVSLAGRLPQAVSDAAGIVIGGVGYLIGGETDAQVGSIISISTG